jgi:hypothetical protein
MSLQRLAMQSMCDVYILASRRHGSLCVGFTMGSTIAPDRPGFVLGETIKPAHA